MKQRREFYNHMSLRVAGTVKSGRRARERCGLLGEVSLGVSGALGLAACETLALASQALPRAMVSQHIRWHRHSFASAL